MRSIGDTSSPICPHCGSENLNRIFSTFALHKSWRSTYEDILSDSRLIEGLKRNDPKALAEWNRRMSRGEKVAPEYEEMIERLERGEIPQPKG